MLQLDAFETCRGRLCEIVGFETIDGTIKALQ